MKVFILLGLLAAVNAAGIGINNYHRFQVISAKAHSSSQAKFIKKLHDQDEYDFWSLARGTGESDIMASPEQLPELKKLLQEHKIEFTVKIEDVGKIMAEQKIENEKQRKMKEARGKRIDWTSYPNYDTDVIPWLDELAAEHSHVTVETIGTSSQGRPMKLIKISTGPGHKAIFIDGTFHAREWISGAFVTWVINELVNNGSNYSEFLSQLDFYILPYANPDGYQFSGTGSNRMWRKTRKQNSGSSCFGVDPNRNFGHMWGHDGVSTNPCSDIFLGESPFSEPETNAIRNYITSHQSSGVQFGAYLTVHSYGQYWLIPWGYAFNTYPPDYPELLNAGQAAAAALRAVHGTSYAVGQSADLLYPAAGASDDWAKSIDIKYSHTLELRDQGRYGFLLPPSEILPTCRETIEALKVIFNRVIAIKN